MMEIENLYKRVLWYLRDVDQFGHGYAFFSGTLGHWDVNKCVRYLRMSRWIKSAVVCGMLSVGIPSS